ncbi:MAG: ATP synthase subunit delta [Turneriella sp.]|nr:ATP synthase subunit delta [Turneriella sp.]
MASKAAYNYALALSQVPDLDQKMAEAQLHLVRDALREDERFAIFLASPRIQTQVKKDAIQKAFLGKVQPQILNLCLILIEKRKLSLIQDIFVAYRKVLDGILGRTYVDVTVAKDMGAGGIDDALKELIIKKVDLNRSLFGLESGKDLTYDVSVKVKPELLAGIRVRVSDYIFDGTVERNLIHWRDVAVEHPIDTKKAFVE